jgi:hypothetical protein
MATTGRHEADAGDSATRKGEQRSFVAAIKSTDDARQICQGLVYAPGVLDSQGEFMLAVDIEKMAHAFLGLDLDVSIDLMHTGVLAGAHPVESFISRAGDPDYPEGSWVMSVKITDPATWEAVKSGKLNGFSFQAMVWKDDVVVEVDLVRDRTGLTEPSDGHGHFFLAQLGADGRVSGGATSPAPDGHVHAIRHGTATEAASDGHSHRFFVL